MMLDCLDGNKVFCPFIRMRNGVPSAMDDMYVFDSQPLNISRSFMVCKIAKTYVGDNIDVLWSNYINKEMLLC